MHAYAILVVNQHLESLLAEAAHERLIGQLPRPSLRDRVASALGSLRSAIAEPTHAGPSVLPTLSDYPYRS
jgi:hypothetical protein